MLVGFLVNVGEQFLFQPGNALSFQLSVFQITLADCSVICTHAHVRWLWGYNEAEAQAAILSIAT